ncbi:hypothetical protein [Nesterenkonia sp. PF2B19]|uniref:hypothetical protein n=1 Tax=Nesterenkonia sp. PF2B19 TaxID=1881858 RepID=UPI00111C4C08|nr:hypothetical protein [Nesterenkonia sp. PF2B19]
MLAFGAVVESFFQAPERLRRRADGNSELVTVFVVAAVIIAALAVVAAVGVFIYCRRQGFTGVSFWENTPSGQFIRIGCYR